MFKDMNAAGQNDNFVDKIASIEEDPKEIRDVMPVDRDTLDEKYRKCSLDDCKHKVQESLDGVTDKEKRYDRGKKVVGWLDDNEKSLMDLGISEVERTKRLENLMERRRSKTLSKFQIIRNAIGVGVGVGNNSCGQISSLHIPKKNPFLYKSSGDLSSPLPGSAPTYMIKNNPFDLPYDPHEEKLILTGDSFEDEFMAACRKEPCRRESSSLGDFGTPEFINDTHETHYDTEFAIKQLRRLGTSKLANKEDDNRQPQVKRLVPNVVTDDSRAIEGESSEKVVNVVDHTKEHEVDHTKEPEVNHDVVSSDQSTSSSEDEPILRPNKEAILHCLSMSRMRVLSQGNSFRRNAESFDCGPSALFDKSKTDGSIKRIHYGSTSSVASDMQVEVDSPRSTNMSSIDEDCKRSLVNSTNPSELDLNEAILRDIDEVSEQDSSTQPEFSQRALDPDRFESTMKPEKSKEQDAHYLTEDR
ncbi:hypothetical protein HanHA300_Chr11g0403901 [Helianthus annuus]|nr:uncharacterized protein LOC110890342 isoform X1 [Helianthus annuus]KAJ0501703.1 hypothetical protein HanHA300_Chr11g0403901 [Helianthus annuus]KAJ0509578.1 hypothetical protein HanIR_Chr11g0530511 [Helianthus annuus]KAJ0517616.1 hypothetical protein HanHA89_Chr11g0427481 [Helianthus annuus]KAJ0685629.1 hypothetical protein HanLR1_Chr11g0404951 [Helianthus annuus]